MTQYLDIYLVGSEPLDSATVSLEAGDEDLDVRSIDADENLWMGDYKIEPPGGAVTICGRASDIAHNDTSVTTEFGTALLTATDGGQVTSPDGYITLSVAGGIIEWDTYVTVLPCVQASVLSGRSGSAAGERRVLAPSGVTPSGYYIGPKASLAGRPAVIEFSYGDCGISPDVSPDRLYIEAEGAGPLESYVDTRSLTVRAVIHELGMFRLAVGEPGAGKMASASYLEVFEGSPNPFAAWTEIRFEIRTGQWVRSAVFDVRGREVAGLLDDVVYPGQQTIIWDGKTHRGRAAAPGVYFIKVETSYSHAIKKVTLLQ